MEQTNAYVFPFECVPQGSRVVIYGAGKKGKVYLQQVLATGYCTVVCMADKNAAQHQNFVVPVILPEQIHREMFDAVILAVQSAKTRAMFASVLAAQGIPPEKIINRQEEAPALFRVTDVPKARKSVLIYDAGGMGDLIIHKKIVEMFIAWDPEICISIACDHFETFLRFLYKETPQVCSIQRQTREHYRIRQSVYQAALYFNATTWTRVDVLKTPSLLSPQLFSQLERMQQAAQDEQYVEGVPAAVFYQRCLFRREDCYRHAGAGILPLADNHVTIPSDAAGRAVFTKMHLGQYVTVNCGNGDTAELQRVAKSWPVARFETLINLLHKAYPTLRIVQLGPKDARSMAGADAYAFGESFGLVREILAHSLLHIDIEGGLVHLATQVGTKCIVLFGPTQVEFFGYPQNINLRAGKCHGCYHLYPDWNRCARDLDEPECMYSITPERVMEAAREYLDGGK